ncbi:MAG TPA: DNA repair protein RecO [Candidatus Woesebacteria bacterium]|nr:DNA repair protein RecO [Candidatus Woesebacteria bacterium]
MEKKNQVLTGLVLKRRNHFEADRVVTLLTQEYGKIECLAKGSRKINSSLKSILEPGNIVKIFLITTKSWPLLVQATLIEDASQSKEKLIQIRQLVQILEIFDKLFVEEIVSNETFQLVLSIRTHVIQHQPGYVRRDLFKLLQLLGFASADSKKPDSLLEYVQEIVEKPMKSFKFLHLSQS